MFIRLLFLLLLLLPLPVMAAWTGIAAFIGQSESDWLQGNSLFQANINFYGLRIEEKTQVDLRVGIGAGQFDLRLPELPNVTAAVKFQGQFVSLYLRWPVKLSEHISLHTALEYNYNNGEKSLDSENTEINWSEVALTTGLSFHAGLLSLRPLVGFRVIEGDITSLSETRIFKLDESMSYGLILDYFVERTAFIRLKASAGSERSMMISFAREY